MFANNIHEKAHQALKNGDVELSIELYTEAMKVNPESVDILGDRAVAYLNHNKRVESLNDFNKALELEPNKAYRYASRAFAKRHFKDIDGAVMDYQKAVELDPEDEIAHNNLGMLLEEQGRNNEAKMRFDRADKLSKQEDKLLDVIDDLDGEKMEKTAPKVAPPDLNKGSTIGKELAKTMSSKQQFKEFISFVKNGFKIK